MTPLEIKLYASTVPLLFLVIGTLSWLLYKYPPKRKEPKTEVEE